MEGALKMPVALMIPCYIGTLYVHRRDKPFCLDEGSAAVRLRNISDGLSRTKEISVRKDWQISWLSLAFLSAYSVAQETERRRPVQSTAWLLLTLMAARVVIPRIKVALNGPTHIEAVSNDEVSFAFSTGLWALT